MCNHIDYPCCGCGPERDACDEVCLCCGEPENYCVCHEDWGNEPDEFLTDAEADADTLASAGWGTDEDYGVFNDCEDYGDFGEY